jgi:hypothetical protein
LGVRGPIASQPALSLPSPPSPDTPQDWGAGGAAPYAPTGSGSPKNRAALPPRIFAFAVSDSAALSAM